MRTCSTDHLLFSEEIGASDTVVSYDLHVLRQAGVLDRIAGMIVGPTSTVELLDEGPDTLRNIILDVLGDHDIPVLGNLDIGHEPPERAPAARGTGRGRCRRGIPVALLDPALER